MSASTPGGYAPHGVDVLRTYDDGFAGRETELAALNRAWSEGTHVFVLHAEGGAGKTRVVAKWLPQVRDDGWRSAGRVIVHYFYSQGSDERRNASAEVFFEQGRLKDPAIHSLLRSLAAGRAGNPSGGSLCVVTSRQPVQEPQDRSAGAVVQQLLDRLDTVAGRNCCRCWRSVRVRCHMIIA